MTSNHFAELVGIFHVLPFRDCRYDFVECRTGLVIAQPLLVTRRLLFGYAETTHSLAWWRQPICSRIGGFGHPFFAVTDRSRPIDLPAHHPLRARYCFFNVTFWQRSQRRASTFEHD